MIGCRPEFWSLGEGGPAKPLADDEVALTESVARELGVEAGDSILLRIPTRPRFRPTARSAKKTDTSQAGTLKVAAVLPAEGLARFGLTPSSAVAAKCVRAARDAAGFAETARQGERDSSWRRAKQRKRPATMRSSALQTSACSRRLRTTACVLEHLASPTNCFQISADQLVLPDEVVQAAEQAFPKKQLQPVVTYLANTISVRRRRQRSERFRIRRSPASIRRRSLARCSMSRASRSRLADDEIVLNRWAADDLEREGRRPITVTFYEPESTHGKLREHEPPPLFKLKAIVELKTADGKPTPAADPKLTPELPGVTDQKSISDWDLPFELVEKIRPQDEDYWDEYRTTPKAFVSLATAKRLVAKPLGHDQLVANSDQR